MFAYLLTLWVQLIQGSCCLAGDWLFCTANSISSNKTHQNAPFLAKIF